MSTISACQASYPATEYNICRPYNKQSTTHPQLVAACCSAPLSQSWCRATLSSPQLVDDGTKVSLRIMASMSNAINHLPCLCSNMHIMMHTATEPLLLRGKPADRFPDLPA